MAQPATSSAQHRISRTVLLGLVLAVGTTHMLGWVIGGMAVTLFTIIATEVYMADGVQNRQRDFEALYTALEERRREYLAEQSEDIREAEAVRQARRAELWQWWTAQQPEDQR